MQFALSNINNSITQALEFLDTVYEMLLSVICTANTFQGRTKPVEITFGSLNCFLHYCIPNTIQSNVRVEIIMYQIGAAWLSGRVITFTMLSVRTRELVLMRPRARYLTPNSPDGLSVPCMVSASIGG